MFEFSVNMDIRVIWEYDGETLILLLDIGHHDILNQFRPDKKRNTLTERFGCSSFLYAKKSGVFLPGGIW